MNSDFNTGTVGCVPYYDPSLNWIYPQSQRVIKRTIKTTKQYDEKGRVTSEETIEEITYDSGYYVTNTTSPVIRTSTNIEELDSTHYVGDGHDH